ncbi:uncharacterized protein LOC116845977 [Odontomachus brunneus]|uniref:uncharacterized protein LOC116845977 n=1 Tax=Odontomachus brunneus TaxID=486640 RepID=UPI0013F213F1|nr:uncharacterized protein LOC116845977 [Odontomachus brunneus]
MATPVLTKKQQRQSLSAKKGPVKGLRNLLAQPCENYWPIVNIDQYPALVTLMNELLPLIRRPNFKIPGSMLRYTSKEKRILAKKEILEKEIKPDNNLLKSVILGINIVTRALEKNNICCILLDANVEPPLLVKHIVVMAQNKKVPILLLPVLKTVSLQTIGFATAALALKYDVMQSSDNAFHALYKLVVEVFKDFKPPKCSLQLFKPDKTCEESTMHKTKTINMNCDSNSNISQSQRSVIISKDIYRYRSSRKERAFVPPIVNKNFQLSQAMSDELTVYNNDFDYVNNTDFISILEDNKHTNIFKEKESQSKNTEADKAKSPHNESKLITNNTDLSNHKKDHVSRKRKNNVTYLSLKVKCIQGSSNRIKATKIVKKRKK